MIDELVEATAAGLYQPGTVTAVDRPSNQPVDVVLKQESVKVDMQELGTYSRVYTATDGSGNIGQLAIITTVQDTIPPVISFATVLLANHEAWPFGVSCTPRWASAADAFDPSATSSLNCESFHADEAATQAIIAVASDSSGNAANETLEVTVVAFVRPDTRFVLQAELKLTASFQHEDVTMLLTSMLNTTDFVVVFPRDQADQRRDTDTVSVEFGIRSSTDLSWIAFDSVQALVGNSNLTVVNAVEELLILSTIGAEAAKAESSGQGGGTMLAGIVAGCVVAIAVVLIVVRKRSSSAARKSSDTEVLCSTTHVSNPLFNGSTESPVADYLQPASPASNSYNVFRGAKPDYAVPDGEEYDNVINIDQPYDMPNAPGVFSEQPYDMPNPPAPEYTSATSMANYALAQADSTGTYTLGSDVAHQQEEVLYDCPNSGTVEEELYDNPAQDQGYLDVDEESEGEVYDNMLDNEATGFDEVYDAALDPGAVYDNPAELAGSAWDTEYDNPGPLDCDDAIYAFATPKRANGLAAWYHNGVDRAQAEQCLQAYVQDHAQQSDNVFLVRAKGLNQWALSVIRGTTMIHHLITCKQLEWSFDGNTIEGISGLEDAIAQLQQRTMGGIRQLGYGVPAQDDANV
jgi:hypothetical protein